MSRRPPSSTLFPYTTLLPILTGALTPEGRAVRRGERWAGNPNGDRKSTRLNSSHRCISYAVFCLKKNTETLRFVCPIHADGNTPHPLSRAAPNQRQRPPAAGN